MKRLAERVLLGGVVSGLGLFAMASCSPASNTTPQGSGNNTSTGSAGASSVNHGGATSVTSGGASNNGTAGNAVSFGGTGSPQGGTGTFTSGGASNVAGGSTGTAGTTSATGGGAGAAAAMCSTDPNFVNATGCFVGCDPALTTDNPDGVQGAFYVYGDGTATTPKSCPPLVNPPCTATGVCLKGTTFADKDYTTGWGCGIGLSLNDTGGTSSVKQAYTGPASCFTYVLTGSSGGNEVRINFTQSASGGTSPYISIPAFTSGKMGTACIKDAGCNGIAGCTAPSATSPSAYDIQFQVVGGNNAGSYNICLTSLEPVGSGGSTTLSQICGKLGAADDVEHVGKYDLHNNINNDSGGTQCVTPTQNGTAVGFTINSSNLSDPGSAPAAYPAIMDGWHYGKLSGDTALPKAMSALQSAMSSVTYTGSDGKYDASYDMWVLPTLPTASVTTPAGGLEVMVWLNHSNPPVPIGGSSIGQFNGYNIWVGTNGNWNYVAYEATGKMSFSGDLKPFLTDAITRKGTQTAAATGGPWLAGVEFGFELYGGGGTNLAVTSYSLTVQ